MQDLTVTEWFEQIDAGLRYRKLYGQESNWRTLERAFYSVEDTEEQLNSGPNIILSTGDALLSSLNVPTPYLTTKAAKQDSVPKARVVERVVNDLVRATRARMEVEKASLYAYLWGVGILKVGYDSEFGWDETLQMAPGNPMGFTLTQFDRKLRNRIEFNDNTPGMPWVSAVCPHDIVVPWGTVELSDAAWIAHRVVRHVDDVKADLKYKNKSGLIGNMTRADFMKSYENPLNLYRGTRDASSNRFGMEQQDTEYIELWEIRDRRTGKLFVITQTSDKFLRNQIDPLQVNGLPFVDLHFVPRTRSFWVTSDAQYLLYHQAELKDISIQSTKHRRLMVLKFMYDRDMISDDELEKMTSADVGAGVAVDKGASGMERLGDAIQFFVPPSPNMQLAQDGEMVRRNAREQVGFSRNQMGEYETTGRRTATEVNAVGQASSLRLDRRQAAIADVYTQLGHKLLSVVRNNWKMQRLVQVLDQSGIPQWLSLTGADLAGEYTFDVGFSVGSVQSVPDRRAAAFQMYMMARQDPMIDPVQAAQFLANAVNDPEFSSIFKQGVLDGTANIQGSGQGQLNGAPSPISMGGGSAGAAALPAGGGGADTP